MKKSKFNDNFVSEDEWPRTSFIDSYKTAVDENEVRVDVDDFKPTEGANGEKFKLQLTLGKGSLSQCNVSLNSATRHKKW